MRVFLSHAWIDGSPARVADNPRRGLVRQLRDALRAEGADVFFDEDEIAKLDDIRARVTDALASSTLLVCWYSNAYRTRRACHWELLTGITTDSSRVVVVNPEPTVDHVLPASLRDVLIPAVPDRDDVAAWKELARGIVRLAREKDGVFGRPPADATRWYGNPPAWFSRFVGRAEQIWELDSLIRPAHQLSGGSAPPPAVVVHGLGGVGKTALALEYAARFAGAYPGGIWWLRARTDEASPDTEVQLETRRSSALLLIAAQLEPLVGEGSAAPERSVADAEALIRHQLGGGGYLWVVDDFPDGLEADALRRWLPPAGDGRVLVTTRGTTYRHVPNLSLGVLRPDEAVELLESAGPQPGDREATQALAERLGYLPLALEVVGGLASVPGTSAVELLAELDDPVAVVEEAADNPYASASPTEHPLSLADTFGPGLRRLDPESLAVLTVGAALNVGPLPTAVVRSVADSALSISQKSFARALGNLLSRSLVRRVDRETFEVHLLVGAATLQWSSTPDELLHACADAAAREVAVALGDADDISAHVDRRPLADFGQELALSPRHAAGGAHELLLLRTLGRFMHVEARYTEALALERRAVALAGERFDDDPRGALTAQLNLGLTLHHAGAPGAEEVVRTALDRLEGLYGSDDIDVLTAKHNLAGWSRANEAEARELGLQVFEARRRLLGADHPHTLFSLHSLLAFDVLPDPYEDFEAAYEDLIARRTAVLGPDHTATLTSTSNFVERLVRLGKPAAALPLGRRLVERRAALYGADHVATLLAKSRLVIALSALPDPPLDELETLARDLETTLASFPGPAQDFARAVDAVSTAGVALPRCGQAGLAVPLLEHALPTVVERLGPDDRRTLVLEHNLAAALAVRGDLEDARGRFEDLSERMRQLLGPDDRLVLRAERQQALVAARLGLLSKALDEQLRLAGLWEERAGSESPEVAEALGDVADTLDLCGETARARDYRARQEQAAAAAGARLAGWV